MNSEPLRVWSDSESSDFDRIRPRLRDSGDVMADYFVALAATATQERELPDAYRWFVQARDIRDRLGLEQKAKVPEEQPFVKQIHQRFEAARGRGQHGLAWGYLNVISELQADSAKLRRELRETREEIQALLRVAREHEPRFAPLFLSLVSTGARRGEALGLEWTDVVVAAN